MFGFLGYTVYIEAEVLFHWVKRMPRNQQKWLGTRKDIWNVWINPIKLCCCTIQNLRKIFHLLKVGIFLQDCGEFTGEWFDCELRLDFVNDVHTGSEGQPLFYGFALSFGFSLYSLLNMHTNTKYAICICEKELYYCIWPKSLFTRFSHP